MLAKSRKALEIDSAPGTVFRGPLARRSVRLVRHAAPGFTLLEIAIVLFIMGLLMSIALPYFGGITEARLKSEARRLAGRASYLYDAAATEKVVMRLNFDLDSNSYFVTLLDPYQAAPTFQLQHVYLASSSSTMA